MDSDRRARDLRLVGTIRNVGMTLARYPTIARQRHPTINGQLTPENVMAQSNKKVWWICDKGHEYSSVVSNRVVLVAGAFVHIPPLVRVHRLVRTMYMRASS